MAGFFCLFVFKNEKGMVFVLKGLTDDRKRVPQSGVVNLRNSKSRTPWSCPLVPDPVLCVIEQQSLTRMLQGELPPGERTVSTRELEACLH